MFCRISQKKSRKNSGVPRRSQNRWNLEDFSERNPERNRAGPQELGRRSKNKANIVQNHAGAWWGFRAKAIENHCATVTLRIGILMKTECSGGLAWSTSLIPILCCVKWYSDVAPSQKLFFKRLSFSVSHHRKMLLFEKCTFRYRAVGKGDFWESYIVRRLNVGMVFPWKLYFRRYVGKRMTDNVETGHRKQKAGTRGTGNRKDEARERHTWERKARKGNHVKTIAKAMVSHSFHVPVFMCRPSCVLLSVSCVHVSCFLFPVPMWSAFRFPADHRK